VGKLITAQGTTIFECWFH